MNRINELSEKLTQTMRRYLYAREAFKQCPSLMNEAFFEIAAINMDETLDALDAELKKYKPAEMVVPVVFTVSIETPRKTLSYNYISEHDAMLAYEKARLDMKLSRESNRVTLSRGDSVLRSADLM